MMSIILYFFTNTFSCQIGLFQFLLFKECILGIYKSSRASTYYCYCSSWVDL